MEKCDTDLRKEIQHSKKPIPSGVVMDFITQMSSVTDYLFMEKIMHRDIKPSHILIQWIDDPVNPVWRKGQRPKYKLTGFETVSNFTHVILTIIIGCVLCVLPIFLQSRPERLPVTCTLSNP